MYGKFKIKFYFLSAYTNTIRNYPIEECFNKNILITNENDKNLNSIVDFSIADEKNEPSAWNSFKMFGLYKLDIIGIPIPTITYNFIF